MLFSVAAILVTLAPSSGGFTCGIGTLPDEKTSTCVMDPAILARASRAEEPNEVDSEASIYIDDATSNLHIQSPPGGVVLVDGIEVAAGVTSDAFEARVLALEQMVAANKIAADAKVSALEAKLSAIDADLKSTTTSTTTTVTSSTQSSTTVTISTTTTSTTTATTVTSTSITTTTPVGGSGKTQSTAARSCKAILDAHPSSRDGVYYIVRTVPSQSGPQDDVNKRYCDMTNGGWTYTQNKDPTNADSGWIRIPFTGKSFELHAPDRSDQNDEATRFHFKLVGAGAGDPHRDDPEGKLSRGGYGGNCEGSYLFDSKATFFVYVGGKGGEGHKEDNDHDDPSTYNYGGWNGGGLATRGGSGGGGGTDVRTKKDDLDSRIIVAGGGGGCGYNGCERRGGDGGGLNGENGVFGEGQSYGGTPTSGGTNSRNEAKSYGEFGKGGTFNTQNDSGGGGGGWYGGSGGCYDNTPGGGGSSFFGKTEDNEYRSIDATPINKNHGYVEYRFM